MALLSVVIPSYNHARYIESAIRSVLSQDYPDMELIIIDDGSRDGSDAVIRAAIAHPGHVRVTYLPQDNAGAHAAIMRGLSLARGEVLTLLNSDDHYEPGRFARILAEVPRQAEFIAFSRLRFIDEHGRTLPPDAPLQGWYDQALRDASQCPTLGYALLRNNISVTSGNLVFSRQLYDKLGGFGDFRMCHDWDFLMRAVHHVEPCYIQRTLIAYRYHDTNTLKSTAHLLESEGVAALNNYLALGRAEVPPNGLAPGFTHWPRYFRRFIHRHAGWFSKQPLAGFIPDGLARPPAALPDWREEPRLALPPQPYLADATTARDAFALLREVMLDEADAVFRNPGRPPMRNEDP